MTCRLRGRAFAVALALALAGSPAAAQQAKQSAEEVASKLANPNSTLGFLAFPIDYVNYGGTLSDAGAQHGFKLSAQPVLPYPLGAGTNLFVRPLIPVVFSQPVPVAGGFENRGVALGDISFDVAVGKTFPTGLVLIGGVVGQTPTATDSVLGLHQWLLGPELLLGYSGKWGFAGVLVTQSWRIGGSNPAGTSITGGQYLYTIKLGNAWQISAAPTFSYNHKAADGDELTLPIGTGIARTWVLGSLPLKANLQYWYYVSRAEAFGSRHQVRLVLTPVIPLPW